MKVRSKSMYGAQRILTLVQAALKSYGPRGIKRFLWNKEYSGEKWDFADNTVGDCLYPHLEKYAAGGSILDLGCGSGNTANELDGNAYSLYLGVDISDVCLNKAMRWSKENGRAGKNRFDNGDILSYEPAQQFDVILFRESMYHVPLGKIISTLDHYSKYLKDGGVFIVRMWTRGADGKPKARPAAMIDVIIAEFQVIENCQYDHGPTVVVFRPAPVRRTK